MAHSLVHSCSVPLKIKKFKNGEECLNHVVEKPDVLILDYNLSRAGSNCANGEIILEKVKKLSGNTKVIMLSAQDSVEKAIGAMQKGAYDYVYKGEKALAKLSNHIHHIGADIISDQNYNRKLTVNKNANIIVVLIFLALFILSRMI